jgi:hypothetical protein
VSRLLDPVCAFVLSALFVVIRAALVLAFVVGVALVALHLAGLVDLPPAPVDWDAL